MFATRSLRMFRPTVRMMRPVPKEEQAVSQRLRRLRHIPPELIPLGVVVTFGVSAAIYSSSRHLMVDKNLRLKRQNRAADAHQDHQSSEEHH
ncbi:33f6c7ce-7a25-45bf-8d23-7e7281051e3c [Thermothielavioides terrestris]|uniref:33f6c7ce-7a25-45bf-8d23-7e7281051e3c n=1 Tax=Thermothielavioides terrestris TaxID=2587410 RepID=A0A446BYR6_9PEZI|nr:33f6c7ce-7a25-45bf-8d23-7e7281051e3c [Thermothielavioides terrestris]